jgi:hypothetical protein
MDFPLSWRVLGPDCSRIFSIPGAPTLETLIYYFCSRGVARAQPITFDIAICSDFVQKGASHIFCWSWMSGFACCIAAAREAKPFFAPLLKRRLYWHFSWLFIGNASCLGPYRLLFIACL